MGAGKLYSKYKMLVTALGLKELDVYRVTRNGRAVDVLRIFDPATGKVALVDLNAPRESFSLDEFLEKLVDSLKKEGIQVSERRISLVKEKLLSQKR